MEILNTFIEQASNIWWGIVAAIGIVGLLYLVIYVILGGTKTFSPFSYLTAIPLLPLLAIQFYLLFGAISTKHKCSEISSWIDAFAPEQVYDGSYSREDINAAIQELTSIFPFSTKFIDIEAVANSQETSLGKAITKKFRAYLNWYIFRRLLWSLCFILAAVIAIIFTMQNDFKRRPSNLNYHSSIDDF